MFPGDTCYSLGCNKIAIGGCIDCGGSRYCSDHLGKHEHIKTSKVEYMGPRMWEGKPIAKIIPIPDVKSEPLSTSLNSYHLLLKDKILALRVYSHMSSLMVENYLESEKKKFRDKLDKTLSEEEKEEYDVGLSLDIFSGSEVGIKNPKIAKLFVEDAARYGHREHIRRASKEMVLVYLVVIFEEFLSNLLSALFSKRHETLKDSEKHILFKDAVDYADINELVMTISKREAKDLVERDIEDLGKRLEDRFNFNLNKCDDWTRFKEFFYRRHTVVHNYGVPNAKYLEKTKNTEFEVKGDKSEWLEISALNTNMERLREDIPLFEKMVESFKISS